MDGNSMGECLAQLLANVIELKKGRPDSVSEPDTDPDQVCHR